MSAAVPRWVVNRRWVALVAVVALAGTAVRVVVLRSTAAAFNADEAYTGIQSFEILDGALPVALGGSAYTLPFESYLYAPFVAVVGASIVPLKLLSVTWWALAGVVIAVIASRLGGRRAGAIAAALLWITPGAMLELSVTAYVGYSSGMLVTLLAFLLALHLLDDEEQTGFVGGAFGVMAGFGFWLHPMFLATLIPMVLTVLWVRRERAAWAWVIGGGLVGCAPLLAWNMIHGFPTFRSPVDVEGTYGGRLRVFVTDLVPRSLGLRSRDLAWELSVIGPLLYVALLSLVVVGLMALVRDDRRPDRLLLPIVLVAVFPVMAIFENLIYVADGRYGIIAFPFLVVAIALGVDTVAGHVARRSVIVVGAVLTVWVAAFVLPGVAPLLDDRRQPDDDIRAVVARLDAAGIDRIAGSYWGVLPIEFGADRRFYGAVTPDWPIRFSERQRVVEATAPELVAFVFRVDDDGPEWLWLPVDAYRREVVGGYVVYVPKSTGAGAG